MTTELKTLTLSPNRNTKPYFWTPKRLEHHSHLRAYHKGYIRCSRCKQWVNTKDPEEVQREIRLAKGGKRLHKKCSVYSPYPAAFITTPRYHGTRRKWVDSKPRY